MREGVWGIVEEEGTEKRRKAMLGGCCVCADVQGYEENPLVYCDGAGCSVAVHQGCYGIVAVPEESWFCAKCAPPSPVPLATCLLCRSADGALKRTADGGWAHVICALYIPEVAFGDVHSMEPVITADVPPERFAQPCAICSSPDGACMQCNRTHCPKYFHVTCAQAQGLLCEEGRDSKNVKYCGYCPAHYAAVANSPNIKFIPAFPPARHNGQGRPGSHSTSSPASSDAPSDTHNGRSHNPLLHHPNSHLNNNNSHPDGPSLPSGMALVGSGPSGPVPPPAALDELRNCVETVTPLSNGPSTSSAGMASPHSIGAATSGTAVTPGPAAPTASHPLLPQPVKDGPPTKATKAKPPGHTPAKRGRPPGSTNANRQASADGEEKPKRPRKSTKKTVKSLLESVSHVVEDTVSSFQAERVASQQLQLEQQQQTAQTAAALLGLQAGGGGPLGQAQPGPDLMASGGGNHLFSPPAPPASLPQPLPPPSTDASTSFASPHQPPPGPGPGPAAASTLPNALEQLLERQWEQGSAFLSDQSQHFDIASLLQCLHQLKSDNCKLEKDISSLSGRKEHLLAVNARLALSYSPRGEAETSPVRTGAAGGSALPSPVSQTSLKGPSLVSPSRLPPTASPVLGVAPSPALSASHASSLPASLAQPQPSALPTSYGSVFAGLPPPVSVARSMATGLGGLSGGLSGVMSGGMSGGPVTSLASSLSAFSALTPEHLLLLQQQQQQLAASGFLPSSLLPASLASSMASLGPASANLPPPPASKPS